MPPNFVFEVVFLRNKVSGIIVRSVCHSEVVEPIRAVFGENGPAKFPRSVLLDQHICSYHIIRNDVEREIRQVPTTNQRRLREAYSHVPQSATAHGV